ncbi:MAG: PEP-CTERM sorting domain-containing protein [Caldimonas sp.]
MVPEPSNWALLAIGLGAIGSVRRRHRLRGSPRKLAA